MGTAMLQNANNQKALIRGLNLLPGLSVFTNILILWMKFRLRSHCFHVGAEILITSSAKANNNGVFFC